MTALTVHTQAELDAALNDPARTSSTHEIIIDSPAGVTLVVDDGRGHRVTAYGSSAVTAYDSSAVHAYGLSAVTSYGSSTVWAFNSSMVWAFNSSAVHAYGPSTVHAYGPHATVAGGVIIDHTTADATTITPTLERTNR